MVRMASTPLKVAFDQVVPPLSVGVPDAVKMRVISVIDLTDDTTIGMRFVRADRYRPVEPNPFDCLAQEGSGCLCIPPRGQAEIDHLPVGIDRPPQIPPFATNADVGFVHMPIDACARQVFLGPPGQFGAKLLHPAVDGRTANSDVALFQQTAQRMISRGKTLMFERRSTRHH